MVIYHHRATALALAGAKKGKALWVTRPGSSGNVTSIIRHSFSWTKSRRHSFSFMVEQTRQFLHICPERYLLDCGDWAKKRFLHYMRVRITGRAVGAIETRSIIFSVF